MTDNINKEILEELKKLNEKIDKLNEQPRSLSTGGKIAALFLGVILGPLIVGMIAIFMRLTF